MQSRLQWLRPLSASVTYDRNRAEAYIVRQNLSIIEDADVDISFLTETLLTENDTVKIECIRPNIFSSNRSVSPEADPRAEGLETVFLYIMPITSSYH